MIPRPRVDLRWAADSDPGLVRDHNEDAYVCDPGGRFLIVADGMGGHLAGEVASSIAVEVVQEHLAALSGTSPTMPDALLSCIALAHEEVARAADDDPERTGMGCTLAILAVAEAASASGSSGAKPSGTLWAANVGDSRIYRLHSGHLEQLSRDHTVAAQARVAGIDLSASQGLLAEHTLTQAIGCGDYLAPFVTEIAWQHDDTFLLCSDGLSDLVDDAYLTTVLREATELEAACTTLIQLALASGGHDNVTVIVARPNARGRR